MSFWQITSALILGLLAGAGMVIGSQIGLTLNEDIYKQGVVEGYEMGFKSGVQFGEGKVIRYYQVQGFDLPYGYINETNQFSEKDTTWYFAKGYQSIDGVKESWLDTNPFD